MSEELFIRAEPIRIIGGHKCSLLFTVVREDGGDVNLSLSGTIIKWILAPWDTPRCPILTLTNDASSSIVVVSPECNFDVNLSSANTYNLEGQYRYQIEITSPLGDVFRPLSGTLQIDPRNYETV